MPESPTPRVTRLAPSPTGALHLGNARTFVVNWVLARQRGWQVVLRIEDLDGPRIKQGADTLTMDLLRWLGLDWDDGPYHQLRDLAPYRSALDTLARGGHTYACVCTRSEIAAAQSAPHADQHQLRYPGTCRQVVAGPSTDRAAAIRVKVPDEVVLFDDELAGPQAFNPQREVGDFVVATKADLPAYQLAVVVDDHRQGVTDVVRGDDLLSSTARQLVLYRLLELGKRPDHLHLPLVLGPDGRRLAKRHGDTRLDAYRAAGVPAERILGLLGCWCGVLDRPAPLSIDAWVDRFDLRQMDPGAVTFSQEQEAWLRAG